MDYEPPARTRRPRLERFARFCGGVMAGFFVVFVPTFFAGGAAFEDSPLPWWAWPAVIAAGLACAAYAWFARRRSTATAAGIWIGTGAALLLAGACFTGT